MWVHKLCPSLPDAQDCVTVVRVSLRETGSIGEGFPPDDSKVESQD